MIKDKQAIFTIPYTFHICGYFVVTVATLVANAPAATDGAEAWPRGATPHSTLGAVTERCYHTPEVRGGGERSNPTSKEWRLCGTRRAERSYSTFKVRRGGREEIHLIQGKEQRLRSAGTAVKRYPMSKVRETQVRR